LAGERGQESEGKRSIEISRPLDYLIEPDGAVIRAHLVEQLAGLLGASKIDPQIAYLTSNKFEATPFARTFALETAFPFRLKRLRQYLREGDIGRVTIKKRGSPIDPEDLRRQLRLSGDQERIIFFTRVMGEPTVLIGREEKRDG
jgi:hypothetical protein